MVKITFRNSNLHRVKRCGRATVKTDGHCEGYTDCHCIKQSDTCRHPLTSPPGKQTVFEKKVLLKRRRPENGPSFNNINMNQHRLVTSTMTCNMSSDGHGDYGKSTGLGFVKLINLQARAVKNLKVPQN